MIEMTYPLKFRKHILAVQSKESLTFRETAKRFSIGIASLIRWHKNLAPSGRLKKAYKIDMEALKQDVIDHPDDFLAERACRFKVTGNGIRQAMKRLGISYKKNTTPSQSGRRGTYQISGKD